MFQASLLFASKILHLGMLQSYFPDHGLAPKETWQLHALSYHAAPLAAKKFYNADI